MDMTITIDATERIERDTEGRYRLIDTACNLNEPVLEAEVIDVLIRRRRRDLVTRYFPMHGFHD